MQHPVQLRQAIHRFTRGRAARAVSAHRQKRLLKPRCWAPRSSRRCAQRLQPALGYLQKGDPSTGLPPAPVAVHKEMQSVQRDWEQLLDSTNAILASEQTGAVAADQVAATLAETSAAATG